MSNPNALFLLADHIKLSLLERKRAQALNLPSDSQEGHISRSLDQLRDGLEALQKEQERLEEAGDETKAAMITDSLPGLQKQFDDLTAQFHGFSSPATTNTLTHPNDPSLAADFAHASSTTASTSPPLPSSATLHPPAKKSLRGTTASNPNHNNPNNNKTVRFQDNADPSNIDIEDQAASALFNQPYRDDPDGPEGYRDTAAAMADNVQVHAYHSRVLREQDEQLDRLGESISRQRELSMQIGDELDDQVAMLEDQEGLVDRHQGRLDRARRQVGKMARSAGDNKQMVAIVVLIVTLILLIAVLK
ncbi:Syntaxin-61 [Cytospora mali]|uniref:Syntaxin-61 n=1 Tax=Cytospora mali TaxID=578113 RepID=A0A194WCR2_CYTMA|nr:Syntaxin-61 [Valsa mali]